MQLYTQLIWLLNWAVRMSYTAEQRFSGMDTEFKQPLNQAGHFNYGYLRGSWGYFQRAVFSWNPSAATQLPLQSFCPSPYEGRVSYGPTVMFGTCCSLLLLNSCFCICQCYLITSSKSFHLHSFYLVAIYLVLFIGCSFSAYTGTPGIGYHDPKN